jgi:hypothetical protein
MPSSNPFLQRPRLSRSSGWSTEGAASGEPALKHGVHQYRLEDFRLDRDVLYGRFAEYYERFKVSQETPV